LYLAVQLAVGGAALSVGPGVQAACTALTLNVVCTAVTANYSNAADNLTVSVNNGSLLGTLAGLGNALTMGGNGTITLNNAGTIDPTLLGLLGVLSSGAVIGNNGGTNHPITINNQATGVIYGSGGLLDVNLLSLSGTALNVQNAAGSSPTTINNYGVIGANPAVNVGLLGQSPILAAYGGAQVNMTNFASGTVNGRMAFATSARGNTFTNFGSIVGSLNMGANSANQFTAVTGSSVNTTGNPDLNILNLINLGLIFSPPGVIDGGANGNNTLILRNSAADASATGSGIISSAQYINFANLLINGGTWTLNGPVVSTSATLNGGLALFDDSAAFGSGTLTANSGAIQASVSGLNLANAIALNSGTGLSVGGGNSLTMSGVISGTAPLNKLGTGSLTLSNANTYTGDTNLVGGRLVVDNNRALGTSILKASGGSLASGNTPLVLANAVQMSGGGGLTIDTPNSLTLSGLISGVGPLTKTGNGSLILANANTYSGGTALNAGRLVLSNANALSNGTLTASAGTNLDTTAALTLNNAVALNGALTLDGSNTLTLANTVSGTGSLIKNGSTTTTLTGTNTYTGGTTLNAGTLSLGNNSALGSGNLTANGGTLSSTGALTLANTLTLNNALTLSGDQATTLNGVISGSGSLIKTGAALLTLNGANTYTGGTSLNASTLVLGNNAALGTGTLTSNGGTLNSTTALNLANAINLTGALNLTGAQATTLNGVISGTGPLNKNGAAALTVNGNNTYSGGTALNGGLLRLGSSTALGTGALTAAAGTSLDTSTAVSLNNAVNLNGTLSLLGSNALTLNGLISGAGSLVKNGTGALTLGNNNSAFSGGVQLGNGSLVLANSGALGTGTLTASGGTSLENSVAMSVNNAVNLLGNLTLVGSHNLGLNGPISGVGSLTGNGNSVLSLSGSNTYSGGTVINGGTVSVGSNNALGSGALTANNNATLTASTGVNLANQVNLNGNLTVTGPNNVTLNGAVAGTGGLIKNGAGQLTLDGNNSYAGNTFLNAGTLTVGNNNALGTGALNTLAGTTLDSNTTVSLGNNLNLGGLLTIGGSQDLLLQGVIAGTGGLNVNGSGDLTLNGNNTYSGVTNLNQGRLIVGNANALGTSTLNAASGTTIALRAGSPVSLANAINLLGSLTLDGAANLGLSGAISGAGGLIKDGTSNLLLSGNNSYSGSTTLNQGTLTVGSATALGASTLTVNGAANLDSSAAYALGNAVVLNADLTLPGRNDLALNGLVGGSANLIKNGAANLTLGGANTLTGDVILNAGTLTVANDSALGSGDLFVNGPASLAASGGARALGNDLHLNATLNLADGADLALSGVLDGTAGLIKNGLNSVLLSGNNTFAGPVSVLGGTLNTLGNSALGASAALNVGAAGTVNLGGDANLTTLTGTGSLNIGNPATLTLGTGNGDTLFAGTLGGGGALNKVGAGVLTLSGNNSGYTGLGTVNGGTLAITGTLGSSALNINTGATLTGTGSVLGAVNVANGGNLNLSSGNSLSLGALNLSPTANLNVALGAPSPTALATVNGHLVLDGTLNVTDLGGFGAGVYRLLNYTGSLTDNGLALGQIPVSVAFSDLQVQTSINQQINLLVTAPDSNLQFWDGAGPINNQIINGGSGTWNSSIANWTLSNGLTNGAWGNQFAVFGGQAGTVTVQGTQQVTGLQFMTDGYTLNGGAIQLVNNSSGLTSLRVDPTVTTTLGTVLSGTGTLNKLDSGTAILNGNNTYSGGTRLDGGTLIVGSNTALGSGAVVAANNTTLQSGANVALANLLTLNGGLTVSGANDLLLSNTVSGSGTLIKSGTGSLSLTGNNTYAGTTLAGGTLGVGSNTALGTGALNVTGTANLTSLGNVALANTVVLGATLNVVGADDLTLNGNLTGSGGLTKLDTGTLTLNGTNSYSGPTLVSAGTLIGNSNSLVGAITNNATLTFQQDINGTYTGALSGSGSLNKLGGGQLLLTGNNTLTGATNVTAGRLQVDGSLAASDIAVASGAELAGGGTVGNVVVNSGGSLSLESGKTLTTGNLTLGNNSNLNVALGTPNTTSLGNVAGDLTLAGNLNITDVGGFGVGTYQLFTATGAINYADLSFGTVPSSVLVANLDLMTTGNLLNLVVGQAGTTVQFWNGTNLGGEPALGGSGTWDANTVNTNWVTNGLANNGSAWADSFAVFAGTAGTVDVNGNLNVEGMQFSSNYVISGSAGDALIAGGADGSTLNVRVDPNVIATLAVDLTGAGALNKLDTGTLVLSGNNTYTGNTLLNGGTLQLDNGSALGTGNLVAANGTAIDTSVNGTRLGNDLILNGDLRVLGGADLALQGDISGPGTLIKNGNANLTLGGANSYASTLLNGGTLTLENALALGAGRLTVGGNATLDSAALNGPLLLANAVTLNDGQSLTLTGSDDLTLAGDIIGAGALVKTGTNTLVLQGNNTYSGGTTINAGSVVGNSASLGGAILNNAALTFNQLTNGTYSGVLSGTGTLVKEGAGRLLLSGGNSLTGDTTINAGTLQVDGSLASQTVNVNSGATLTGNGSLGGAVNLGNGANLALAAGNVLTLGSLAMDAGSNLNVGLGVPSLTALANVTSDLTLDGTLNVTDLGGYGIGVYRIMNYGGSLTDNGLAIGTSPTLAGAQLDVQTAIGNQINLIVNAPNTSLQFWDGSNTSADGLISGGAGTWGNQTNWTNLTGTYNSTWGNNFAVFSGAGGLVSVDGTQTFSGLQFTGNGYSLVNGSNGSLNAVNNVNSGYTSMRVDVGVTATVNADISGTGRLNKLDIGTLVLGGNNSYSGGTLLSGGSLIVNSDSALGSGTLTTQAGTVLDTGVAGTRLDNALTLNGALGVGGTQDLVLGGVIGGSGSLVKNGTANLTLLGNNSYTTTTLASGGLLVGNDNALGTGALTVSGAGSLAATGGSITLGNAIGLLADLTLPGTNDLTLAGDINGTGALIKTGSGSLILGGNNNYGGGTQVLAGTLIGNTDSLKGSILNNAALTFQQGFNGTFAGTVSGTGQLIKQGSGELLLAGVNTFTGPAQVQAGTLRVEGSLGGAVQVQNGATLAGGGSIGGTVSVASGGNLNAASGSVLTLGGLQLDSGANLNVSLGAPSVTGLIGVTGNVSLAGLVNVTDAGGFGPGIYRLIDYTGTLNTQPGFALGTLPVNVDRGNLALQTSIDKQVNLVFDAGDTTLQFWDGGDVVADGQVDGGSGTWNNANRNWTNSAGSFNNAWGGSFAVFQGAAGTVTVEGAQTFSGLQFTSSGYTVQSGTAGSLVAFNGTSTGYTSIRVDSGVSATVSADIIGAGTLNKLDSGTLTLSGNNAYTGGTLLSGGRLLVGSDTALGIGTLTTAAGTTLSNASAVTLLNNVQLNGALAVDAAAPLTLAGVLGGAGSLDKTGSGELLLTGANTYTGGTTISAGGVSGSTTSLRGAITNNANLTFIQALAGTFADTLSGTGTLNKQGVGSLLLTGANTFSGDTNVQAGTLLVDGSLASNAINVANGAALGGTGSLAGTVNVADGGTLALNSGSTLSVGGLALSAGSVINTGLGLANNAQLIDVAGQLTLDGTLNVTDLGGFGDGVYNIARYGSVIDNGLALGILPGAFNIGNVQVQIDSVTNRVNLVVASGLNTVQFWDGGQTTANNAVDGGGGVWGDTNTNWTTADGSLNTTWNDNFAVFSGTGGAVTLDGDKVVTGLQFAGNGYSLGGDALVLAPGLASVRVDNGVTATVDSVVTGAGALNKWDTGTLVLNGDNTYLGGTLLNGGALVVGSDLALGSGLLTAADGTRLSAGAAQVALANTVLLNGGLTVGGSNDLTLNGAIAGPGALIKQDSGRLTLNGVNAYASTTLNAGTLNLGNDLALGTGALNVTGAAALDNSTDVQLLNTINLANNLTLTSANDLVLAGTLTGTGTLIKQGAGDLLLTGSNSYAGLTLQAGSGTVTGNHTSLVGNISNNGALVFDQLSNGTFNGTLSGTGTLQKQGTGWLMLTGANSVGATTVTQGNLSVDGSLQSATVQLANGASLGGTGQVTGNVSVADGASVNVASADGLAINGNLNMLSGSALNFALGVPTGNPALSISGNAVLNGTANITDVGGFGVGVYNLVTAGSLTNNGLTLGLTPATLPAGWLNLQQQNNQLNLVVAAPGNDSLQFWDGGLTVADGTISGGSGIWGNGLTNWANLDGTVNTNWGNNFAVFGGTAGTVTLNGVQSFNGLQFTTDGYVVQAAGGSGLAMLDRGDGTTAVRVNQGVSATIDAPISGTTALNKLDDGTLVLNGANTYTGGTLLNGGTLVVGNANALGSGTLTSAAGTTLDNSSAVTLANDVQVNGNLNLATRNDLTLAGDITGAGGLVKTGTGTLVLNGSNSYSGGTLLSAGNTVGNSDSLIGTIVNNATLTFQQLTEGNYAGNLSGTGNLVKEGSGTLLLTGASSYTGGTSVNAGTLAGNSASLQGAINTASTAQLVFAQDTDGAFSGTLGGSGAVIKEGAGSLLLTGNQSHTGDFTVNQGTLVVGNAQNTATNLASNVVVGTGGTLSGTGNVSRLTNRGFIRLFSGPRNLSVSGNFTNAPTGVLSIVLGQTTAPALNVSGQANLGGTLQILNLGTYTGPSQYSVITTGNGFTGQFDRLDVGDLPFLMTQLNYGSSAISLTVNRNATAMQDIAVTPNQRDVATAIQNGGNPALVGRITSLNRTQALRAFQTLSGESMASTSAGIIQGSTVIRNTVIDRMRQPSYTTYRTPQDRRDELASYTASNDARGILAPAGNQLTGSGRNNEIVGWMQVLGGWGHTEGNNDVARMDRNVSGFMLGADKQLNDEWRVGVAAGTTHTSLDVKDLSADSSVDSYHLSTYLNYQYEAWATRLGLAYSWHDVESKRSVVIGNESQRLKAHYKGQSAEAFGEVGYAMEVQGVALEPFVGVAHVHYDNDTAREKGGDARLEAKGSTQDLTFTTVGLRAGKLFELDNGTQLVPSGSLGWRHALGKTDSETSMSFIEGGGAFKTRGVPIARDSAVVEAGLDLQLNKATRIGFGYSGQLSSQAKEHAVTLNFNMNF